MWVRARGEVFEKEADILYHDREKERSIQRISKNEDDSKEINLTVLILENGKRKFGQAIGE